jgi:hypothetical protein
MTTVPMKCAKPKMVTTWRDTHENHRISLSDCPHCGHFMDFQAWDAHATHLILEPKIERPGHFALMAECPACFKPSWAHAALDEFKSYSLVAWPAAWIKKAEKTVAELRLAAMRKWGADLCHGCTNLQGGRIELYTHAQCQGKNWSMAGESQSECKKYVPLVKLTAKKKVKP